MRDADEVHGHVLANEAGGHVHPNTLYRRCRDLTARAGVPVIRCHDLRHASATRPPTAGAHGKIVQERLGHANVAMTLDPDSHVTADMQGQAADRLDELIGGQAAEAARAG